MPTLAGAARSLVDEVTAMVEPRRGGGRRRKRLVLVERGDEFECYRANSGNVTLLARGSLDGLGTAKLPRQLRAQPLEVRLDGSRVLSKVLRVPAAGRSYLDPIVRHQLDRATPWAADRVVYDYSIAEDEPATDGQIAVRLVATSKDVLDGAMSRLTAAGLQADVVGTSEDPVDRPSSVNLLQAEGSEQKVMLRRRVKRTLVAIVLIGLTLSALSGWRLYALDANAAEVQAETDAVRARIEAARAGMSLSDSRAQLLARKQDETPLVILIDELSKSIPTNTYLSELSVEDGEVHLVGQTSDAPALIEILEQTEVLSDVRFAAPTMRDEGATQDRFEIAAKIVSVAKEE